MKRNLLKSKDIEFAIQCAAVASGFSAEVVRSKNRKRVIVWARFLVMNHFKSTAGHSLATIGIETFDKDHATVLHACKTVKNLVESNDKDFKPLKERFDFLLVKYKTVKELFENESIGSGSLNGKSKKELKLVKYNRLFEKVISKLIRTESDEITEEDFNRINKILNF